MSIPDAYERIPITRGKSTKTFLYALHMNGANNIQVGFGMESVSGLQRAHVVGPQVHEQHTAILSDWLRRNPVISVDEAPTPKMHPFTSAMDNGANTEKGLEAFDTFVLSAGRHLPLLDETLLPPAVARALADAIDRVSIRAFGHPSDWDCQYVEMKDGRYVWFAYDSQIGKIRLGLGYHNADNIKVYGSHSYALGLKDIAGFCSYHFQMIDAALPFWGLPSTWPSSCLRHLNGVEKQNFVRALLLHADKIWPGQIT